MATLERIILSKVAKILSKVAKIALKIVLKLKRFSHQIWRQLMVRECSPREDSIDYLGRSLIQWGAQ